MKIELKTLDTIQPDQLAYHANNPHIKQYLRNSFPYPYTLDHALSFIQHSLDQHALDFGIVVNDECIGCIGVSFHKDIYIKNCEIGYWISETYWGQGIMKKVIKMICPYLFENYKITKIYAEVFAENVASIRVLEDNGFTQEGYLRNHAFKDGEYHDLIILSLMEDDYGY